MSAKEITVFGKVKQGKLVINRAELNEFITNLPDCNVFLSIKTVSKNRSNAQNAYYWAIVLPKIVEGFNSVGQRLSPKDDEHLGLVHLWLKKKFLGEVQFELPDLETGEVKVVSKVVKSSTLKTHEFELFLQQCRDFAQTYFSITIPLPNEIFF